MNKHHSQVKTGPIAIILGLSGFFGGLAASAETDVGDGAILISGLFLGLVGIVLVKTVEKALAWLFFMVASILLVLLNTEVRSFVAGVLRAMYGQA